MDLLTCTPNTLTPPVPWIKTVSPGFTGRRPYRAFQLVRAAQVRVLASRKFKLEGARTRPFSLKTPYSRKVPSMTPPRPVFVALISMGSNWWPWLNRVTTLSPFFHFVTLEPTSTTSPAPSEPGTTGSLSGKGYNPWTSMSAGKSEHWLNLRGRPSE